MTARRSEGRRPRTSTLAAVAFVAGSVLAGSGGAYASHQFSDVPSSNQFHADIAWMVDNDIANGYQDGTFRPTAPVSRQAFAAFLHRYNGKIEPVSAADTPTAPVSAYYRTVDCPTGMRAISGGGTILATDFLMVGNGPTADGQGWRVMWEHRDGSAVQVPGVAVHAVCIPE